MRLLGFWIVSLFFCFILGSEAKADVSISVDSSESSCEHILLQSTDGSSAALLKSEHKDSGFNYLPFFPVIISTYVLTELREFSSLYFAFVAQIKNPKENKLKTGLSPPLLS